MKTSDEIFEALDEAKALIRYLEKRVRNAEAEAASAMASVESSRRAALAEKAKAIAAEYVTITDVVHAARMFDRLERYDEVPTMEQRMARALLEILQIDDG